MEKELLLSIIIPVYNVEKYLKECIVSVLNNKLHDYEIILVDDGSKDNSGKICDEFKEKYPGLITVIHKENGGLSSARNAGIKIANGKYLMFVDSDDRIQNFDIDKLTSQNTDIVQYKMVHFFEKNNKYVVLKDIDVGNERESLVETVRILIANGTLSISACDKLIKRKLLVDNKLFFKEGLLSEDINWSLELYLYADSISINNDEIYVYRQQREGSISTKISAKNITSSIYIFDKWLNYEYKNEKIKDIYYNYLAYLYSIIITTSNKKNTTDEQKEYIKKHRYILKYDNNYKVKMCNKVIRMFGFHGGVAVLKMYLFLKNKGLIKL